MGNHNHEGNNNVCDMNSCNCNMGMMNGCACGCGGKHRAHIMRFVLGLVLLLITFCFGMNIGELRGQLEASQHGGYGEHMMRYQNYGAPTSTDLQQMMYDQQYGTGGLQ